MTVASVQADTVAATQGLLPGDRLVRANEQWLQAPLDWQRVRLSLDVAAPSRTRDCARRAAAHDSSPPRRRTVAVAHGDPRVPDS